PMDLSQLVEEVAARLRETIERSGCTLELRVEPNIRGEWDRLRLEQVLVNLLTNALTHAAPSAIELSLHGDERIATVRVRDHGPGIAEVDQQRIFERFVRSAPKSTGGMGLG